MLKPGDRFGDYTVVRLLGKGGMGAVYLLENAEDGQVAAKILDPASSGDHESRKRFLREAELALGVKHPNLVETYDVGEDPDTGLCYILMEYVPGGSLADRLKAGPLPINDAIRIVYQIASVLELARGKQAADLKSRKHPLAHVLTRAIGAEKKVSGDWRKIDLAEGDRLLVCSDGVHDVVADSLIGEILTVEPDLPAASVRLRDEIVRNGAPDNYSYVMVAMGELA